MWKKRSVIPARCKSVAYRIKPLRISNSELFISDNFKEGNPRKFCQGNFLKFSNRLYFGRPAAYSEPCLTSMMKLFAKIVNDF